MDLFSPYSFGGNSTPPPNNQQEPQPSLNDEVTEVIGQLGRFWGGFRKQSQAVLESARKDIGQVVSQAQEQLGYLGAPEATASTSQVSDTPQTTDDTKEPSVVPDAPAEQTSSEEAPSITSPMHSLFSRIQASLPPDISTRLQNNIPESLRDATGHVHIDFNQLRSTLTTEFQRVQGVTLAQAEDYVHRSEALLRDAGEFLKDAVKVVPPEGAEGPIWDGSDVLLMPFVQGAGPSTSSADKEKEKAADEDSGDTRTPQKRKNAGTRADTLIQRLKQDPESFKSDPLEDETVKALYEAWRTEELESHGGIGSKFWSDKIQSVLDDKSDMGALESTRDTLVPLTLDSETFWTRFFFRVYQIEKDEERRRALLAETAESEEDFSWEDDEEMSAPPEVVVSTESSSHDQSTAQSTNASLLDVARKSTETIAGKEAAKSESSSRVVTPANTSPRESSEDSYDLVSSGNISAAGPDAPRKGASEKKKDADVDDSGDSDWE